MKFGKHSSGICVVVLMILLADQLSGQTDFFYSFADLRGGAQNEAVNAEFRHGEYGTLFIYWTTNGPADSSLSEGAFIDLEWSIPDVVKFTTAETFNFEIEFNGTPINERWDQLNGDFEGFTYGNTGTVTDNMIDELSAFTAGANGTGILESNTGPEFIDVGFDAAADAFIWGRIDFVVTGTAGEFTELLTSPGDGMIVDGDEVVPATFGNVSITVIPIPEPTCSLLIMIGIPILLSRQRLNRRPD